MSYPDWQQIIDDGFHDSIMFNPDLPMIDSETPTFMGLPLAKTPEDLIGADVVIIGSAYVAATESYAGVPVEDWSAAAKRVRQQSCRYRGGYVQDLNIDVFEHLKVVDYGDAPVPEECQREQNPESILKAQANVEAKVNDVLAAGAIPIVVGQNSPCSSYAIAKPIAERAEGRVGMISLDTHWDSHELDELTEDPRIAGSASWKHKTYEFQKNFDYRNLVEIGERGMLEYGPRIRGVLDKGVHFYPMWRVRTELGIAGLCEELRHAYDGTSSVYVHFDMDVLGGAGPVGGDILGELAEPIGMTDYEVIRIANEIGKRGLTGMSFICIPPGSKLIYRVIVFVIMYLMAGLAEGGHAKR